MFDEYSLLLYFVAQIVRLMAQLKINVFNKYKDKETSITKEPF